MAVKIGGATSSSEIAACGLMSHAEALTAPLLENPDSLDRSYIQVMATSVTSALAVPESPYVTKQFPLYWGCVSTVIE